VVLAAAAYLSAAAVAAAVLIDLARWGVVGSGVMGLLVALLVVVGRAALAAAREAVPTPSARRTPQGGAGARR